VSPTGYHDAATGDSITPSTSPRSVQIRNHHSPGRGYYERKLAEGKTRREAVRALKLLLSDVVWRHLVADSQRVTTH
jgi:hypothetical protein